MRKVQLLLVCLMLSVAAFAADKVIKLPKPNLNRTGAVMKALSERHSTREYASKSLSLSDLSDLLWAANGINRKESGMRTAPSALNKQDVDVYVVLPEGSYLYDAKNHQLTLVAEGDHRGAVAGGQAFVKTAPVSLVLISDLSRFGDAKSARSQLMGAMDSQKSDGIPQGYRHSFPIIALLSRPDSVTIFSSLLQEKFINRFFVSCLVSSSTEKLWISFHGNEYKQWNTCCIK